MLCGPSGVGKTETAIALAETLYGGAQNIITLNMSEFQEKHTVSTLKGVMEDGEGRLIDFKNTLIILTSNVGSEELMDLADATKGVPDVETAQQTLRPALLNVFPAKLWGGRSRFDFGAVSGT